MICEMQFVVLAMVAGFATATSDSDAQYSPLDAPVAPALPYTNTVTPGSRPTGFSYSVQTFDTPKVPTAANYVNPYALGGYRYNALQQPYYNQQGLLNAYTGYGAYNPYVAAPYAASAYGYAANPYTYAGYPYNTNNAVYSG